jgi:glycosyltransferase involved in cell wall biosynthesis
MNILFVINSDNKLFEIDSGGALRNNLFVRALSEVGHVDVICFSQNGIVSNIQNCDVIYSKRLTDFKDLKEVIRSLLCVTIWPSNPYSYYQVNKQKATIVNRFVEKNGYDIIACRYVETSMICGLLKYKEKLVIELDDNRANVLKFEAIQKQSMLKRWKKLYESKRIGKMLKRLCNNVRCSFCSNPLELPSPRTVFLHNTTVLTQPATDITESSCPRILFVGFLNYYPNWQGITHFVKSIFPVIRKAVPHAELRIVGDGKSFFLDYLNEIDGVEAVGRVDDLASEYQEATIVIIPIYYGSGTCVKFVEAMLMNRPVISTPIGARGFSDVCKDGEDYMLANNDEEFASKTIELLSSVSRAREMAKNGYEKANSYYSQKRFSEIVKTAIS